MVKYWKSKLRQDEIGTIGSKEQKQQEVVKFKPMLHASERNQSEPELIDQKEDIAQLKE
jgi:hypothetical protein